MRAKRRNRDNLKLSRGVETSQKECKGREKLGTADTKTCSGSKKETKKL